MRRGLAVTLRLALSAGLASNLYFRQFNGSKHEAQTRWRCEISWFCSHFRQVIASNRGKELVQVTSVSSTLSNVPCICSWRIELRDWKSRS